MKAYAVLVIYNEDLALSKSFNSVKGRKGVQILVADNSTDPSFKNQEEARKAGAWFLSMGENAGLSKAYNAAFERLKQESGDWVVLLDDDTVVPEIYWDKLKEEQADAILLPLVKTEKGTMLSPAEMRHGMPKAAANAGDIHDITGINSGMAIPKTITDTYRYDERLFLDYVDHAFIRDMKARHVPVRILDVVLSQRFSAEDPDRKKQRARLQIQKKDMKVFYEDHPWKAWYLILRRYAAIWLK